MKINKIFLIATLLIVLLSGLFLTAGSVKEFDEIPEQDSSADSVNSERMLFIPPILEGSLIHDTVEFSLQVQEGEKEFIPGSKTPTYGYNGSYLGPTIRVRNKENVSIFIENTLNEDTTLHWHGAHVPAEMDGGPFQVIKKKTAWNPRFTINQQAATLWYHPHLMGKTAEQVYNGLAGLFIIEDEISDSLLIPREYGVNDIPLIFQDRKFNTDGTFSYRPTRQDIQHGYFGNVMLVNGSIEPEFLVAENIIRFRILNGSNSTVMRYFFESGIVFHQIATDGGFLEKPVPLTEIILSPGERAEILVDFSQLKISGGDSILAETNGGAAFKTVQFVFNNNMANSVYTIPEFLVNITQPETESNSGSRQFVMSTGMGGNLTINGKQMDLNRVDERVPLGGTEIWEILNSGMGGMMMNVPHSMHIHDIQFLIIDINGKRPPENLRGWKDTVLLWPGDRVRLVASFVDYTGKYMYHCHLLEHEDQGMMGVFEVVK